MWTFIVVLFVLAVLIWIINWLIGPKPKPKLPADPTRTSSESTPAPAPAAPATPRSGMTWLLRLLIIALLAGIGWWAVQNFSAVKTIVQPQATTPKKGLRQHVVKRNLSFVGGEKAREKNGLVEIRDGGQAAFLTKDLPWRKNAKYRVVFHVLRQSTGEHHIKINGGRGGTFDYKHFASPKMEVVVFFETGLPGKPEYFNPGINQIEFWSPGDNVIVQYARIEMAYWE